MQTDILQALAAHAHKRVAQAKEIISEKDMEDRALAMSASDSFPFEKALSKDGLSFICECKKASPSKGLIAPDYAPLTAAKDYAAAGGDCISVLTEPKWFLGSSDDLRHVASAVDLPCLRKDFIIDPYMIYEAKVLGAACVLLICSLLDEAALRRAIRLCDRLGLSALVEAHDAEEVRQADRAGARIIGINNRNLRDFSVDLSHAADLEAVVPDHVLFVAESGIKTPADAARFRACGADAVLIGEALMRAPDRRAFLKEMRGEQ
ncbi:MAG: indole-3-glycerol phosphate synthase TrpC [Eubacteriales bacterium]|nr:indole-3-glycerol phosphate synthase TrpC [Eubacteriales bacterium]